MQRPNSKMRRRPAGDPTMQPGRRRGCAHHHRSCERRGIPHARPAGPPSGDQTRGLGGLGDRHSAQAIEARTGDRPAGIGQRPSGSQHLDGIGEVMANSSGISRGQSHPMPIRSTADSVAIRSAPVYPDKMEMQRPILRPHGWQTPPSFRAVGQRVGRCKLVSAAGIEPATWHSHVQGVTGVVSWTYPNALKICRSLPAVTSRLAVVLTFAQFRTPDFRAVPSRTLRPAVTSPIRESADGEFL